MPRPPCCRRISGKPGVLIFKPAGIPAHMLEQVVLALDEFEAIRLADLHGFYQEQAAARMKISRPTFGRIIASAHRKIAEVLIVGKALRIEGGPVYEEKSRTFQCNACKNEWDEPDGGPGDCPHCHRVDFENEQNDQPLPGCHRRRRRNLK